jgi:hypothetical protein
VTFGEETEDVGGELGSEIARSTTAELDRETLISMRHIIETSGKIGHAHIAPGRETSEVRKRQASMSIVRPVYEVEEKSMARPFEEVAACRWMVSKILMQGSAY